MVSQAADAQVDRMERVYSRPALKRQAVTRLEGLARNWWPEHQHAARDAWLAALTDEDVRHLAGAAPQRKQTGAAKGMAVLDWLRDAIDAGHVPGLPTITAPMGAIEATYTEEDQ